MPSQRYVIELPTHLQGINHPRQDLVLATSWLIEQGGALIFYGDKGAMVAAYGPTGWLSFFEQTT
jgi:hypothetical protein